MGKFKEGVKETVQKLFPRTQRVSHVQLDASEREKRKAKRREGRRRRQKARDDIAAIKLQVEAWNDPEATAQFRQFCRRFATRLQPEEIWTTSATAVLPPGGIADGLTARKCFEWFDAQQRQLLRTKTISIKVTEVEDKFKTDRYGFFLLIDNWGKIVYPPQETLNLFAECEIKEVLKARLVTEDSEGKWLEPISFDYSPSLGFTGCRLCFISGKTDGSSTIKTADRPFLQGLASFPPLFQAYLKAKRDSPSGADLALAIADSVLQADLLSKIPSAQPWGELVQNGGKAIVGSLHNYFRSVTSLDIVELPLHNLADGDVVSVQVLNERFHCAIWQKDAQEEVEADAHIDDD